MTVRTAIVLLLSLSTLTTLINAQSQPLPCQRWAHQTTISDSNHPVLWIQGGELKTSPDQTNNTWTNALLSLDLSTSWNAGSPALSLVEKDNGNPYSPPAVSLGALWSSADGQQLYLWGGQFADNPAVNPGPMNTFAYNIATRSWKSINTTGDTVLRPSEGASALVPAIGSNGAPMAYYFGGHLDWASVAGWSTSTPRVFLDSMVQLDLGSLSWTNYSSFTAASNTNFVNATVEGTPTIRADGTLTYVPSVGPSGKGVLVAIGGGQNFQSLAQNSNRSIDNSALDVFDLSTKTWVKQATQGNIPSPRINHCTVRGTAKVNGNPIHQIFVYGGQIVNGSSQSTEMYVLTIPGFTWTFIGDKLSSQPSARAGHSCDLIGSQMIVIGGYVASDLLCDSQSVYIFDTTSFTWKNTYTHGLPYKTPDSLAQMIGGAGVGHSTSGSGSALGGDGSRDPDVSTRYAEQTHSSSVGAIVGGLLSALVVILLIIFIWMMMKRKKQRRIEAERAAAAAASLQAAQAREKSMISNPPRASGMYLDSEGVARTSLGSEEITGHSLSMALEKHFQLFPAASDDPEHDTEGFEPQFSTRLVPRQHLRVMNPESDGPSGSPSC
ncbi:hypothetical protein MJO28_002401 [Puccinia striiformis f. sp. tritici]|uniref:Uncharacterized protein n=2 Tax=Puccinia striiformis f. sp. tritici TaxID=168172 RepID=A0A0L0VLQ9_9BASI|nr:hypothetical protein Pst134EA_005636 [Puccinia striiformis f. sp. tritici]KAH9471756.1 hypothetical protein Pst134EA_005636 [Puccinia striiformis f. sp. tritici]KAI7958610.1 hypothetical protein MJO28_002401 [Puccinia striiformis f. sp. tritici]KAI7964380.1 hypothetical protein MJO29_002478 [Puccinia striiformis f. sp. tritici]KNF00214.1 hypothetical protein PSTG_06628 [Puccinia striiformis f. sp. tritici PST-78]